MVVEQQGKSKINWAKGIAQGALGLFTMPFTTWTRASNTWSNSVKNYASGKTDNSQRYRYPRAFNENQVMPTYEQEKSHAATALRSIAKRGHT